MRNTGTFKEDISSPVLFYGDMASNQSLLNSGEILRLKNKSSVDVDVANSYSGYGFSKWAAGTSTPIRASMERGAYLLTNPTEWVTYNGTPTIHDRSNNLVYGTPGNTNWINATALSITTIVSDNPDPSLVNQSVTVTVTVVAGVNTPSGTVAITGANTNCSITLSSGFGSCSVSFSSVGSKTLTATYSGDATHPTSSDTEPHQVSTSTTNVKKPTYIAPTVPPPELVAIN